DAPSPLPWAVPVTGALRNTRTLIVKSSESFFMTILLSNYLPSPFWNLHVLQAMSKTLSLTRSAEPATSRPVSNGRFFPLPALVEPDDYVGAGVFWEILLMIFCCPDAPGISGSTNINELRNSEFRSAFEMTHNTQ